MALINEDVCHIYGCGCEEPMFTKNGKHLPIDSEDQWEVVKQRFFRSW